jgi:hypothetical protein
VPTQSCICFLHYKYTCDNVKMLPIATTSNGFASNQDATLHGVKKIQTIWRIAFPTQKEKKKFNSSLIDFCNILMNDFLFKDKVMKWHTTCFSCKLTTNSLIISQFLSQVFSWAHTKY